MATDTEPTTAEMLASFEADLRTPGISNAARRAITARIENLKARMSSEAAR